ncbi:hypothetical protein SAMN05892877_11420 [Rhizobium subbaraonis]|uniref:Uncharacterized protein n=1 Tax=Rhizobium subbaraonis TaxID=908946 RepID=A0A285UWP7_9HYPH|nr:hypothetical protein [Rhizobium subbaraonis]SOC45146.1 hypothetical protein SAMN05892877_11420 [Rhizobium subbaraonis]
METTTIGSRADFAQWAIERAGAIIAEQGSNLALAARDNVEDKVADAANALGQAIVEAMLEVFDGLMIED